VTFQDLDCAKNRPARLCENDGVCPDIRLGKSGGDAMQLLALGTGLWIMVGVVFFRFQVEKKRELTPPDKDKQDKQRNTADFEQRNELLH
jgi:hypothetical protein